MTSERSAVEVMEKAQARIEEILRAVTRIEDAVNRLAIDGKGAENAGTAVPAAAGALEGVLSAIREVKGLQAEAAVTLRCVREDVKTLMAERSGDFTDGLGPDGLR
jgi:hypothetical protein